MQTDYLATAIAARAEAMEELQRSPAFAAVKVFDDAVVALGGQRLSFVGIESSRLAKHASRPKIVRKLKLRTRPRSQGDIAVDVLTESNRPMALNDIMKAVESKGGKLGGTNPINNFRSTLSRDERVYSVRLNGDFLWWLTGKAMPDDLNKAAGNDQLSLPAASLVGANWKGGEAHAKATN